MKYRNIKSNKYSILGVLVNKINYDQAVNLIIENAKNKNSFSVTALAVHGVLTGVQDSYYRFRLNNLDMVVPDGQPVRWALNWLYKTNLKERVYGPELMLRLCKRAAKEEIPIFLFGGQKKVIQMLEDKLIEKIPNLNIAGVKPSIYRTLTIAEKEQLIIEIKRSGSGILFVGIGCPRQEVWAYEFSKSLDLPIIAVGAAFDFHAGFIPQAPVWLQERGFEWLFRLFKEPRRLWRRYLYLNPIYIFLLILQILNIKNIDPSSGLQPQKDILYG